jgi:hypothetical protein
MNELLIWEKQRMILEYSNVNTQEKILRFIYYNVILIDY